MYEIKYFIVNSNQELEEVEQLVWAEHFEKRLHVLKRTKVGKGFVSTICLGFDHSHGYGPPLLFETMVFDVEGFEDYQERHSTVEKALAGHEEVVTKVKLGKVGV